MLTNIANHAPSPNPAVDGCSDGQLSPITNLREQFKLVQILSLRFGRLADLKSIDRVRDVVLAIDQWMDGLPRELSKQSCDHSQDERYPWLPCQRKSLHCFAHMAQLTPLKQFLIKTPSDETNPASGITEMRRLTAQLCIECIETGLSLCRLLRPIRGNFHFVVFVLFDTATFICSALLHDPKESLPERPCLLQKVEDALGALETIMAHTRSARHAAEVVRWLLARLSSMQEKATFVNGRVVHTTKEDLSIPTSTRENSSQEAGASAVSSGHSSEHPALASYSNAVDSSLDCTPFPGTSEPILAAPSPSMDFASWTDVDMGGLEYIWDWEGLNLAPGLWSFEDNATSRPDYFQ